MWTHLILADAERLMMTAFVFPSMISLLATHPAPASAPAATTTPELVGEEGALMRRVGGGDEEAFGVLVERYERWARTLAGRLLGDFTEAEDVVQEAFLQLWTSAPRWTPRASVRAWLRVTVTRRCLDRQRRRHPDYDDEALLQVADPTELVAQTLGDRQRRDMVFALIQEMPPRQRAALLLIHVEEMSGRDAAEAMSLHVKAFESLLGRARRALGERWQASQKGARP